MTHFALAIGIGFAVLAIANVFISALWVRVAHECYKRAQAASTPNMGKSSGQH